MDGSDYLRNAVGEPLVRCLAELVLVQPYDPIEYIALWLYKHSSNVQQERQQAEEDKRLAERLAEELEKQKTAEALMALQEKTQEMTEMDKVPTATGILKTTKQNDKGSVTKESGAESTVQIVIETTYLMPFMDDKGKIINQVYGENVAETGQDENVGETDKETDTELVKEPPET